MYVKAHSHPPSTPWCYCYSSLVYIYYCVPEPIQMLVLFSAHHRVARKHRNTHGARATFFVFSFPPLLPPFNVSSIALCLPRALTTFSSFFEFILFVDVVDAVVFCGRFDSLFFAYGTGVRLAYARLAVKESRAAHEIEKLTVKCAAPHTTSRTPSTQNTLACGYGERITEKKNNNGQLCRAWTAEKTIIII